MRKSRFTEEFKAEAIKQVTERGHKVVDVAQRLGVSDIASQDLKQVLLR